MHISEILFCTKSKGLSGRFMHGTESRIIYAVTRSHENFSGCFRSNCRPPQITPHPIDRPSHISRARHPAIKYQAPRKGVERRPPDIGRATPFRARPYWNAFRVVFIYFCTLYYSRKVYNLRDIDSRRTERAIPLNLKARANCGRPNERDARFNATFFYQK